MKQIKRGFASDNNSGIAPSVLQAIADANVGHEVGYGDDPYTDRAKLLIQEMFGQETEVFFMLTGTGTNVLAIQSVCHSFQAVLCAQTAHINVDECGSPEKITGSKLVPITTDNGKLTPELIQPYLHGFDFEHHAQPRLISISQVTELGTVYSADEIRAIADLAHEHHMLLHVDGARIANAAVALNQEFRTFTKDAGVDILSFGGTKNGMMIGEALLFFQQDHCIHTKYFRKQSAQLFSKMRFVSAQFCAYLEHDVWKKNSTHSNEMAQLLAEQLRAKGIRITQEVVSNGVFVEFEKEVAKRLLEHYFFYPWDEHRNIYRLMTSFDTQVEDIEGLCALL